jgi:hypothetical protein
LSLQGHVSTFYVNFFHQDPGEGSGVRSHFTSTITYSLLPSPIFSACSMV